MSGGFHPEALQRAVAQHTASLNKLVGLHHSPVYITEQLAKEIVEYAKTRAIIINSQVDNVTPGDKCIALVLGMLKDAGFIP